jgi:chromosome segregation protein
MLTRERERRELPRQLRALREERRALEDQVEAADAEEASLRDALSVLEAHRLKLESARSETERERAALEQQVERAGSEAEWYGSLAADADRELAALEEREEELRYALADSVTSVAEAETALGALEERVTALDAQPLNDQLAERRAEVAATRQEQAAKEAERRAYRQNVADSERQIVHRQQRAGELAGHLAQIEERIAALHAQGRELAGELQVYAGRIEPAERELEVLEGQQVELETQEEQARIRLQAYESRYNQSQLRVTRQEDQLAHLQSQIEDDLGMVDLEMGEALSGQPLLPIEPLVSSLPEVQALPEGLEDQIHALRRALNRLGAVNPEAPQEYREARERLEFLATQCEDLDQAAAQLRHVIAELDEVMQREFKRTFSAVAHEFETYFARLFNGGSARLELTDPDDLMTTGIDVVARPPGKRQQGLAVLSGGERALTAAALIFAILAISPTPFCVLDEVDAALDEANVGRFRQVLRELAAATQFVVITHNRYTIEVSDIVYGISMGADGASCVISQRMQDVG